MKIPAFNPLLSASLALYLALVPGLRAEDTPAAPPADNAAAAPAAPDSANPPSEKSEEPKLRRLDVPPSEPASEQPAAAPAPKSEDEISKSPDSETAPAEPAESAPKGERRHGHRDGRGSHSHNGNAHVSIWDNATLREGESAEGVISIVGSSTSAGHVDDAVVSVLGSSTSSGDVGAGVVSILGSSRVTGGSVGDVVVSILGNSYVNAPVHGDVVAVLGNVELGPDAVVSGDINCVGGTVIQDPKAVLKGQVNHVAIGGHFSGFDGLHAWITKCLMWGRPLAFGANLMWAWWLAIGFLVLYIFLAALFPSSVEKCLETFEQRPGRSVVTALLVMVLTPILSIPLLFTLIGTPALILFLLVAGLFGKAVMLAWLGRRITNLVGDRRLAHPAFAVIVGGVVVLGLYTVPVVGFITAKLISWLGMGAVVLTIFTGVKQKRAAARPIPSRAVPPVSPMSAQSSGFTEPVGASSEQVPPGIPAPAAAPAAAVLSAASLARAGFWIRIAASVLDAMLVGLAIGLLPHGLKPNYLLLYATYCIVLWGLRGTTIGGIVCSLKVVRLDDRPVDWPTALVRGLAGFLSLFAAGIGFIWVAFDDQRQSWHDKIAGTTVVQVPRGVSLV